jgi:hypothetical protein
VIAPNAYIASGVELGSALTDKNLARIDALPPKAFHAEPLARGIAPISRRSACLLVRHGALSKLLNLHLIRVARV